MLSSSPRRKIAALLLAILLLKPWVAAAEPHQGDHERAAGAAWSLLGRLWSALTAAWVDEGCTIDPNGRCGDSLDNGCTIDPDGRCGSHRLNNGCTIDPYGRCGSHSTTPEATENVDEGCTIDPYGGCRGGS